MPSRRRGATSTRATRSASTRRRPAARRATPPPACAGGEEKKEAEGSDSGTPEDGVDQQTGKEMTFADQQVAGEAGAKGTEGASSPSAETSDGKVSVAGAVAVNIELASAQASIGAGLHVTAGWPALGRPPPRTSTARRPADGSAVLGAVGFDPSHDGTVDFDNDTIDLGGDHGLKTGDKVTYSHGNGGGDIGGLHDGDDYFVNVRTTARSSCTTPRSTPKPAATPRPAACKTSPPRARAPSTASTVWARAVPAWV